MRLAGKIIFGAMAIGAAISAATLASAQAKESPLYQGQPGLFGATKGTYARFALGTDFSDASDGNWMSPGPSDPHVFFDLSSDDSASGTLALGAIWQRGLRGEIALSYFGEKDVAGPWSFTVPASPGPHADVSTSVQSTAVMANLFYDIPAPQLARTGFQPYVMAGLGVSRNKMNDWTRTRASAARPVRTFEGDSNTDLAFSLGVGGSWKLIRAGRTPVTLDVMYQYFDLGDAQGGSTPLPGNGASVPRDPLNFDLSSHVLSIGVRIPLN